MTLWSPSADAWDHARIGTFARRYAPETFGDYTALWEWSVNEPEAFWLGVWDEFAIEGHPHTTDVLSGGPMPAVVWFEGARLNYAQHMLRSNGRSDTDVAVVGISQTRERQDLTVADIRAQVASAAAGLRRLGVGRGDRVVGLLPNIHETLVSFLATAAVGAVWSSCSPEFGARAILDRWAQIEPTVLITVDGYRYGSTAIPLRDTVDLIRAGLPTLRATVGVGYLDEANPINGSISWEELLGQTDAALEFEAVPFDHPLYILYSSGTTGLPKPIVHGHGGVLLEHSKQLGLQMDLGSDDRFFWFSTTGWMMWNYLISGLLVGSAIVLFDGNPAFPSLDQLWSVIAETKTTFAGFGAPHLMACEKAKLRPVRDHDLSHLRGLGSTGAPLPESGYHWAYSEVGPVPLTSISGGTDVCSAFLGGAPVLPIVAGRMSCRQLGWSVEAFDADGRAVVGTQGELMITKPAPSMPIALWGDDGSLLTDTYFGGIPGVWQHGDWITIDDDGSCSISGRSDATLNRGGVRLGTADFYTVVEADQAVSDSLVVHLDDDVGGMGELILFIVLRSGEELDAVLRKRLSTSLRTELSPRHGPDKVIAVDCIPRTISGKKLEVPVKRILQGVPASKAASAGVLADPSSLDPFISYAANRSSFREPESSTSSLNQQKE